MAENSKNLELGRRKKGRTSRNFTMSGRRVRSHFRQKYITATLPVNVITHTRPSPYAYLGQAQYSSFFILGQDQYSTKG
jgi:hypothetical protein